MIAEYEQTGTGTNNAKPCRFFVYGNSIDEVLAMFYPGTPPSGDPNDFNILTGFVATWLLDSNDGSYDDTYDDPNDDFIDYRDFATNVANIWTYTPKVPEQRWYYMKDALGSVMGLMGSHPNAKSEFHLYDVYGKPNTTSAIGNPYMFTSRRVDVLDGGKLVNQHSRMRTLDYNTGRWMTIDLLGYVDGLSLYEYVRSNPVLYSDVWGLAAAYVFGSVEPYHPPFIAAISESRSSYNTVPKTWENLSERLSIKKDTMATIAGGYLLGYPHAAKHLKHFTNNTGVTLDIGYSTLVREDGHSEKHFNKELKNIAKYIDNHKLTGIKLSSGRYVGTGASTVDWGHAVGGYYTWGYGRSIRCSGGMYRMQWTNYFRDVYDWDINGGGVGGFVSDSEMAKMHRWGEYQEYIMVGDKSVSAKWVVGNPDSVTY